MYKRLMKAETGAVSMLTVIFVAIILTVITTSFIRLSINEQRESIDDDLTTRAYYAAESGVQDAIIAIKNSRDESAPVPIANADECQPHGPAGSGVLSSDSVLDVEYTCQLIDLSPDNLIADLGANQSEIFELNAGGGAIDSFTLSWHIQGIDSTNKPALRTSAERSLLETGNWNSAELPAMMRLQIISVPTNDTDVQRDEIGNVVAFLNPVDIPSTSGSLISSDLINGELVNASCDRDVSSNEYVCNYSITDLEDGNNNYYLKVTSLYRPANIKIEAYSGIVLLELIGEQAAIDVTGRAGDVYRRVEERVDLSSDNLWPDYAVFSAEDICKNFRITSEEASGGSPPGFTDVNAGVVGSCIAP